VLNNIPEEQWSLFFMVTVTSFDTGLYVVVLPNTLYYSGILLCFSFPPSPLKVPFYCEILGSHSGGADDSSFLGC